MAYVPLLLKRAGSETWEDVFKTKLRGLVVSALALAFTTAITYLVRGGKDGMDLLINAGIGAAAGVGLFLLLFLANFFFFTPKKMFEEKDEVVRQFQAEKAEQLAKLPWEAVREQFIKGASLKFHLANRAEPPPMQVDAWVKETEICLRIYAPQHLFHFRIPAYVEFEGGQLNMDVVGPRMGDINTLASYLHQLQAIYSDLTIG